MSCPYKHTRYQPKDEEFRCPECGSYGFTIESGPGVDSEEGLECEKLHEEDGIECEACGYEIDGKTFVNRLLKANEMIKCPHCKGSGYIRKEK